MADDRDVIYEDVVNNHAMAQRYQDYMLALGVEMCTIEESYRKHDQQGSSDFGNCTYICPGIQPMFSIGASDWYVQTKSGLTCRPHTPAFHSAAATDFAFDEAMRAAKANAALGIDLLTDDAFFGGVRAEWTASMKAAGRAEDRAVS